MAEEGKIFSLETKRIDTQAQRLNVAIRTRANAIKFDNYRLFLEKAFECPTTVTRSQEYLNITETEKKCQKKDDISALKDENETLKNQYKFRGVHSYELLKTATEVFLLLQGCGVNLRSDDEYSEKEELRRLGGVDTASCAEINDELTKYLKQYRERLPYLDTILNNLQMNDFSKGVFCSDNMPLQSRVECPCMIELIWSYWHEEGMIVQALNAISLRFQNKKTVSKDPLANLTLNPLRPLSNLLWGYIQDEHNRLSLQRRAYEYDHEYGLSLIGKAVPVLQTSDSRSKFIEAFHNLLNNCMTFYKEENNKLMVPDPFPLLNALKEVHLLLAEGAHNQFGDLPYQARVEMLMQQWLLARPEMYEFLGRRPMMPYSEGWMGAADSIKALQGWTDVSAMHFRDLGVYGEQILLSIRYGNWSKENDAEEARNWALYWKSEIQSYSHAYRVTTGVDLAVNGKVDATKPSVHMSRRLEMQLQRR